ncbi:MAG: HAMP domain-containing histidine kinase [Candidatus Omnitrophica bacterium]|jgi:signal transduction histidine kinase|nr:HAMP domain-containing histidine kinase [Candidatus Omnitrophota bacterium]
MQKNQAISLLRRRLAYLENTIRELDEQAKLIIKSDMELKLYQQEIDDKLNKLTLIRNLIVSSIHTLDREKIFFQINEKVINDLGFKKGVILDYNNWDIKINVGFEPDEVMEIKNILQYKKDLIKETQLIRPDNENYKQLLSLLGTNEVLITPIKVRQNIYAIFLVSNLILHAEVEKPEEETLLIIGMYLSQCLDNISLFEDLYHTKDSLEKRIKERTNELVRSLRTIEVISKMKSDFISSVSHELRTPLTSVKGFSSLLVEEKFGKLPENAKERLIKIDENVDKLMEIVNALLDISRIESGRVDIKIVPAEIIRLIKDTTDFLSPQMTAKNLTLTLELPEKLNVYMDKNLIERALTNIISNAIKFTPQGGKIKIGCKKEVDKALIFISDSGYGIEKEAMDKIFQEFYRVNNPIIKGIKGSGLGLSLVKRIIETHKQKIWLESEPGKGTTFYFTLKVVQDA